MGRIFRDKTQIFYHRDKSKARKIPDMGEGYSASHNIWMGLGFLLSAVNPKNLLMCVGARTIVGGSTLATGQQAVAVAINTLLAACTVAIPVVGYLVASERLRAPLEKLRVWLQQSNAAVMSVPPRRLGVVLIGKGLGGL